MDDIIKISLIDQRPHRAYGVRVTAHKTGGVSTINICIIPSHDYAQRQ